MKYLQYRPSKKYREGLSDRRLCLMFLLAEAKLSGRIAVLPKFRLTPRHNNGKTVESYLINTYFRIDKLGVDCVLEDDFIEKRKRIASEQILEIKDKFFDKKSDKILIVRNLQNDNFWNLSKLHDVICLAKNYHGVGAKFVIPLVTPPRHIKEIGDTILSQLVRPIVGLHLRRGDRLNRKLDESMNGKTIINKLNKFDYGSVFYCSNDQKYGVDHPKYFSISCFKELVKTIDDNYILFCIEMYIIDNSDISVRTFNDSSPFYFMEDQSDKNYSICNYSMHGSNYRTRDIPGKLIKCDYESYTKNDKKGFLKRGVTISRTIHGIRHVLSSFNK